MGLFFGEGFHLTVQKYEVLAIVMGIGQPVIKNLRIRKVGILSKCADDAI